MFDEFALSISQQKSCSRIRISDNNRSHETPFEELRISPHEEIPKGTQCYLGLKVLHLAASGALVDNGVLTAHRKHHNSSG
jgi:hypothetical protein